jgi:hypothetical protein
MGHSAELIQKIRCLIEQDYLPGTYRYQSETSIPGTRMFPDILVSDQANNMICAVEIGYTRPEKLTAYRDRFKIPDVRWYVKQGKLHADVKEVTVALTVQTEPAGRVYAYSLEDCFECPDCLETMLATDEDSNEPTDAEALEILEDALKDAKDAVSTLIVTDYVKAWFACFCDKCGSIWFDEHGDAEYFCNQLREPRDFGCRYGRRTEIGWEAAVDLVREHFNLELRYEDGLFFDPNHDCDWHKHLLMVRKQAAEDHRDQV